MWQIRARRNSSPEEGWQSRDDYRDFPRSTEGRGSTRREGARPSGAFDPLSDASGISEIWERRAEEIQRDAQRTARQAVCGPN